MEELYAYVYIYTHIQGGSDCVENEMMIIRV